LGPTPAGVVSPALVDDLTPSQIRGAYGISQLPVADDGAGQTIAIVDAYDDPSFVSSTASNFSTSDLHVFDTTYGLPDPPSFLKLDENGGTNYPSANTGWATEEALDVEWAHAIAPDANIILFEAATDSSSDLMTAVNTARSYAGVSVVSMSWSGSDGAESQYDPDFTTPSGHIGVTFLAATGDNGAPNPEGYPAYSSNVIGVGGTTLNVNGTSYDGETGWSGSGGGQSAYETEPSYQTAVQSSGSRESPDVSLDADPDSGVYVYDSYGSGGWTDVGGTSVATPCWAGLMAIVNQARVAVGSPTLNPYGNPTQALTLLYGLAGSSKDYNPSGDFNDITSGSNGEYTAAAGYDMVTGIGSPVADLLVPALAPVPGPNLAVTCTHVGNFRPGDVGDTYTITVTNSGTVATSGTVTLVDSLPSALTATSLAGSGWSVNLATLTATCNTPLAPGASYPALTLTVNVASNAPSNVTNVVTASGGGAATSASETASDPTFIGLPQVVGATPSLSGGTLALDTSSLAINFNVAVLGAGTAANYQLQSVGPDGLLGTADDVPVALTASYSGTTATLSFSPLAENVYRLTVDDTITDTGGVPLDGNGGSTPGSNWTTDFVVVDTSAGLLAAPVTYSTGGSGPWTVVAGAFSANGEQDLAVANADNNTVAILMNNGNGTFGAPTLLTGTTFDSPDALAVGDFNGDGKLDLAVANGGSNRIRIFDGNGNGTFTYATRLVTGNEPSDLATGDFNGHLDLAVANYYDSTVEVFLNNGSGTFASGVTYSSGGTGPQALAVADFNGDGKPDIAVANSVSNSVGVLLNTGSGAFSSAATYGSNGSEPLALAAGNLNGKPDLVVANFDSGNVGVLLNAGNGTFPAEAAVYSTGGTNPSAVAVADLNGDGKPDVVVTNNSSNTVGVLLGNGDGTLQPASTFSMPSGFDPLGMAIADFTGSGKLDVAVTSASATTGASTNTVGILLNYNALPPVVLGSPNGLPFAVAVGAFGAGELVQGYEDAFNGYGRLMIGGALFQPGSLSDTLANSGQSVITASGTFAGLAVSREVTVPNTGSQDFARTVDTFTNSSASAITTTVEIVGALGSNAATTVFATSDGTVVSPSDQWIGTDGGSTPAIISYIHGPSGLQPSTVGVTGANIFWTYSLTVPAGQTVSLAYLTIVAATPAAAVAEANALVTPSGFGGQAAAYLTASQLSSIVNFGFDVPPTVTNVVVAGSAWSSSFLSYLATLSPENVGGYSIPVGSGAQLLPLPWTNIDTINVTFSENVVVSQADLLLAGVNVAQYNVAAGTFAYNSSTDTATWTLSSPIAADKLLLELDGVGSHPIEDLAGTPLDGAWTNPTSTTSTGSSAYPSGNGTAGSNFLFRFNVLPGNVSQSGYVQSFDGLLVLGAVGSAAGEGNYTIFKDVAGIGSVQSSEAALVLADLETSLPAGQPAAESFPTAAKPASGSAPAAGPGLPAPAATGAGGPGIRLSQGPNPRDPAQLSASAGPASQPGAAPRVLSSPATSLADAALVQVVRQLDGNGGPRQL
jgi:uncharacterized repeat protein (TIGR01451 family)